MNKASSEDVRVFEVKGTPPCLQKAAVTLEPRGGKERSSERNGSGVPASPTAQGACLAGLVPFIS